MMRANLATTSTRIHLPFVCGLDPWKGSLGRFHAGFSECNWRKQNCTVSATAGIRTIMAVLIQEKTL